MELSGLYHVMSLASVKSRLVLPFWYRLTRVVPEKGPLNVCVYVWFVSCVNAVYWTKYHSSGEFSGELLWRPTLLSLQFLVWSLFVLNSGFPVHYGFSDSRNYI